MTATIFFRHHFPHFGDSTRFILAGFRVGLLLLVAVLFAACGTVDSLSIATAPGSDGKQTLSLGGQIHFRNSPPIAISLGNGFAK